MYLPSCSWGERERESQLQETLGTREHSLSLFCFPVALPPALLCGAGLSAPPSHTATGSVRIQKVKKRRSVMSISAVRERNAFEHVVCADVCADDCEASLMGRGLRVVGGWAECTRR